VKGYLLDTSASLLALSHPDRLGSGLRKAALSGPNVLSVVSYWEVVIKSAKGNLDVGDPRVWWLDALDQLAATPLGIRQEHVSELHSLPPIHKDPFDRMLIAQAIVEELDMATTDEEILRYASARFRAIG
jgi:PIN domain nuclease of toxin-antitoxin system